jgi:hypothetical protein
VFAEFAPLVALLAAAWFAWRAARFRRSRADLAAATVQLAIGLLIALLSAVHSITVAVVAARRDGPLVYDFRFYSLELLGGLLIALGLGLVFAAAGIARGEVMARRAAIGACLGLLAVNLPLMPLQGFAIGFSVFAAIGLAVLLFVRPRGPL